jgi:hypothetical protein
MLPAVDDRTIGVHAVTGLHPCRATAKILRVGEHDRLCLAIHRRRIGGVALSVNSDIVLDYRGAFGVESGLSNRAL